MTRDRSAELIEVAEAAAHLLGSLSENQARRARRRDTMTQVHGAYVADLETAVERLIPGLVQQRRAELAAALKNQGLRT
ncbi:hypothetical protein ACH473_10535 [Cellulosimicrobium funkei]|uniref:hypothetical protein n=1 Tax=Cellulosimicrobium funkei TaxID=264251 RepID=UPI00375748EC